MKKLGILLYSLILLASCSKINSQQELPALQQLHPESMVTELPVMHLEVNPEQLDNLFTYFLSTIKIPARVTVYGIQKDILIQDDAVIEIKGVGAAAKDMKPIGFVLAHSFNNSTLNILSPKVLAKGDDLGVIQTFRLRNSSQDYGITMLKDLAFTELALRAGFDFELKYGRPMHLFINASYYGLHNFRTEVDRLGLSQLLQVDSSLITLLEMDSKNHNLEYREGDEAFCESFIQAIKTEDVTQLQAMLDVENFMDYIIFEDYIGNTDWPHNNARAFSIAGSKIRFLLYDLDMATTRTNKPILPEMEYYDDHVSRIYQILLAQDPDFKDRFVARKEFWYTQLSIELFTSIVDELAQNITDEIPYLIARRGVPESNFHWRLELEQLKRELERRDRNNRKKYQLK
ncbi:MAG: hypothetical protein ACI9GM_000997 [Salibacteraceae bacterium]|jgi:hypothetical protein